MSKPGFNIRALGEIAIRCRDYDRMAEFYRGVLGLQPLEGGHREGITFYRIAEGHAGHTAVLALFKAASGETPAAGPASSLHHLALTLDRSEQDAAIDHFERLGIQYLIEEFSWIGWRGVFLEDPDGNTVELVAYDATLRAGDSNTHAHGR